MTLDKDKVNTFIHNTANDLITNYSKEKISDFCLKLQLLDIKYQINGAIKFETAESFPCEHSDSFKSFRGSSHENYSTTETFFGWVNGFFKHTDQCTYKSYRSYTKHDLFGDRYSSIYCSTNLGERKFNNYPFSIGESTFVGDDKITIKIEDTYLHNQKDTDVLFYELLSLKTMNERVLWESAKKILIICKKDDLTDKLKSDVYDLFNNDKATFVEHDLFYTYVFEYKTIKYFNKKEIVCLSSYRYSDSVSKYGNDRFYYSDIELKENLLEGQEIELNRISLHSISEEKPFNIRDTKLFVPVLEFSYSKGIPLLESINKEIKYNTKIYLKEYHVYFFGGRAGYVALSRHGFYQLNFLLRNGYLSNVNNTESFYKEFVFFKDTFKEDPWVINTVQHFINQVNKKQKYQIFSLE